MSNDDERLIVNWLKRRRDGTSVRALAYDEVFAARRCANDACGAALYAARYHGDDLVCRHCGALWDGGRTVSADDGAARAARRSELSIVGEDGAADAKRPRRAEDDRRVGHQSYQRCYHFNERLAARQNVEPRIPLRVLRLFGVAVRYVLGVDARRPLPRARLTPGLLQSVCRAFRPLKVVAHAERWLQLRYYLVTGRTERIHDPAVPEHPRWDIPWLRDDERHKLRGAFKQRAQRFDELYYRPSSRFTTKDLRVAASQHGDARHNMLQLNYMIQRLSSEVLGEARARELRTEFCFPTSRSPKARARLDRMYAELSGGV